MKKGFIQEDLAGGLSDVLGEIRTMLTVAGVIFAFLLNAVLFVELTDPVEQYLVLLSFFCTLLTIMIFAMPVLYHHVRFPFKNKEKFILRSHAFILMGLGLFFITLFLTLSLAFYRKLGNYSFLLSAITFFFLAIVYYERSNIFRLEERLVHSKF